MNIPLSNINFSSAKRNNIKKADELKRNIKLAIPIVSPGYLMTYFSDGDVFCKSKHNSPLAKLISKKQYALIQQRNGLVYESTQYYQTLEHYYNALLNTLKETKNGNCAECAEVTKLALNINGHEDAEIYDLFLKIKYIDKQTGEVLYDEIESLDHSFVITPFVDKETGEKEDIVIDTWLDFVGTINEAKIEYEKMSKIRDMIKPAISQHRSLFRVEMMEKLDELIAPEDYILDTEIAFMPTYDRINKYEHKEALVSVWDNFPELDFGKS